MIKKLLNKYYFKSSDNKRTQYKRLRNFYPPFYQEKTLGIYSILKYINNYKIDGDIIECGVGRGVSLFTMGNISNLIGLDRKLYGFDSFEGFPEPTQEDRSYRNPQKGEWGDTSLQHVAEHFRSTGFGILQKELFLQAIEK